MQYRRQRSFLFLKYRFGQVMLQQDLFLCLSLRQLQHRLLRLSDWLSNPERSEEIVSAAVKEAKNEKESILAQANKEADAARKKASEQIVIEREEMYRSMQKEMVEVALAAAGKLLEEKNGEDLDREAIDAFVKEATNNAE